MKQLWKSGKTDIEVYSHTPRSKALHDYMLLDSKDKERYKKEWNELKKNDFQNFFDNFYPSNRSLGQHEAVSFQFPTIQFGIRISKNETDFYQNEEKSTHHKFVTDKHDVKPMTLTSEDIRMKFENLLKKELENRSGSAQKSGKGGDGGGGGDGGKGIRESDKAVRVSPRRGKTYRSGDRGSGGGTDRGKGVRGRRGT